MTPSHSRKNGKRLRYYISRRLIRDRKQNHPDAWRLPAEQLDRLLKDLALQQLGKPDAISLLTKGLSAVAIAAATKQLSSIQQSQDLLGLIKRVDLCPGSLKVLLDEQALAAILELKIEQLDPDAMLIEAPFQMRRRGVELRLHLGETLKEVDRTLVQNIVKARCWLALITDGKPIAEIAKAEELSNRRIQDLLPLAFLAPDLMETISTGEQPIGLNTEYLVKTGFPTIWSEQRTQFATL